MYLLLLRIFLKTESSESGSFNRVTWNHELRKIEKRRFSSSIKNKNYARNSKVESNLVARIVVILYQRGLKFKEFVIRIQRELILSIP